MVYTVYWCVSECWDSNSGYDGTTEMVEAIENIDYNIGQNGGQFVFGIKWTQYPKFIMLAND
jgi:hypothetical protein